MNSDRKESLHVLGMPPARLDALETPWCWASSRTTFPSWFAQNCSGRLVRLPQAVKSLTPAKISEAEFSNGTKMHVMPDRETLNIELE